MTGSRRPGWSSECGAGAAGALATLALVLTLGLLANTPLGPEAAAEGIPASFIAVIVGGTVFALLGRGPMPAAGPASAPTLILAGLVAGIAADPAFHRAQPQDVSALLALTAAAIVVTGMLQVVFAFCGFTRAAKYVPQPVLAGFMNGVAVVFVIAQLPTLLGWSSGAWSARHWNAIVEVQPATLAIGFVTMATIWTWPLLLRSRIVPVSLHAVSGALAGLAVGCVAYTVLAALLPASRLGGLVGSVPPAWPIIDRLAPLLHADPSGLVQRHALDALTTAALIALVGTMDIVLNGLALDRALATRTEPRRELLALGVANLASGLCGGLPVQLIRARALATWQSGGRTRFSLLFGNGLYAVLALVGTPLLALLPKVVLGGIMVMVGLLLFDAWSLRLAAQWLRGARSTETRLNLALVTIVCVVSVVWGYVVGIVVGALLAVAVFIRGMNRSLIHDRRSADAHPSRRIYAEAHEALLQDLRPSIAILDLEGALFFGSADRLAREVDALPDACRTVVLDLHRLTLIDASGAIVLAQIRERLRERGIALLLAGLAPQEPRGNTLVEVAGDALPPCIWHPDVDRAVEEAELKALDTVAPGPIDAAVPLARSSLMTGLDDEQCARLSACLERRDLAAGERVFAEGEAGDRLYVLTEGSISVLGATTHDQTATGVTRMRFVTCSPGMMFGEVAMLDHRGRSAEALADAPSTIHALSEATLRTLETDEPRLAALVYRNIAVHLSTRLRIASSIQIAVRRQSAAGAKAS